MIIQKSNLDKNVINRFDNYLKNLVTTKISQLQDVLNNTQNESIINEMTLSIQTLNNFLSSFNDDHYNFEESQVFWTILEDSIKWVWDTLNGINMLPNDPIDDEQEKQTLRFLNSSLCQLKKSLP